MTLRTENKMFSRMRSVARKNFGDCITLICAGVIVPITGRFEFSEDIEFFEEMRAKSKRINVTIDCELLAEYGITIDSLSDALIGVDSKTEGESYYEVKDVLRPSINQVRLTLGACKRDIKKAATSKRANSTKNRGRVREPLARCYVNRSRTYEDL